MTASFTTRKTVFNGSGSTGPFTFNWRIIATSDIIVTKISAAGVRTVLAAGGGAANYQCTLVDSGLSGGSITLGTALAVGEQLLVEGNTPVTQTTPYRNQGRFAPESHELSYDKLTLICQEFYDQIRRSAKLTADSSISGQLYLPTPSGGKAIKWNSGATGLENSSSDVDTAVADATTQATAAAASATAAASSASAATTSETNAATSATAAANSAASIADFRHILSTGSANAYVLTYSPSATLSDGALFRFEANFANTGAATLNINGTGAKAIRKAFNTALAADDIKSGQMVVVAYDAANDLFQMQSQLGNPFGTIALQNAASVAITGGTITGTTFDNGNIGATTPVQAQARRPVNTQTGTTYTFVLGDEGKCVTLNNGSAITVTIPANASVAFPTGTEIDLIQLGAGQVTLSPAGGVTMNSYQSKTKIAGQYGAATLKKLDTNTWVLVGNLGS